MCVRMCSALPSTLRASLKPCGLIWWFIQLMLWEILTGAPFWARCWVYGARICLEELLECVFRFQGKGSHPAAVDPSEAFLGCRVQSWRTRELQIQEVEVSSWFRTSGLSGLGGVGFLAVKRNWKHFWKLGAGPTRACPPLLGACWTGGGVNVA